MLELACCEVNQHQMSMKKLNKLDKRSIGKIAERIVMNELEARGYRVTDLNKDGLSANADLVAAKGGKVWQIQVKGATNKPTERWWVQYGHCTQDIIERKRNVFNQKDSFYHAQYVALVAVRSPKEYRCFVMPVEQAEKVAQYNLDGYYRQRSERDGRIRKPGKMWRYVEKPERERINKPTLEKERGIIQKWEDFWNL
jgi:hypothetical protein